jgi:hypothetical protein
MPLSVMFSENGIEDTLGKKAYSYTFTPYQVHFEGTEKKCQITFDYDVCEDLPIFILRINIVNNSSDARTFTFKTSLDTRLRTSHTYSSLLPDQIRSEKNNSVAFAEYNSINADSACVFVYRMGKNSPLLKSSLPDSKANKQLQFASSVRLNPGENEEIIQLIGMCRIDESDEMIRRSVKNWPNSRLRNTNRVTDYTFNNAYFRVDDTSLQKTLYWAKAVIASNLHYIDDHFLPMPCPAEYNFFFTHDMLLASLGAVYFDTGYVKNGLLFLNSLVKEDRILPHAYYWKDGQYVTEFCTSDNWNHLWFIIVASSYLKHSGDEQTVDDLFPILKKSLNMALENKKADDLMYAGRPDWWDIGNVYGARSYTTILTYKALQDYVYIASVLNKDSDQMREYLILAERMKLKLGEKLWNDEQGYLLNLLDGGRIDHHYYAGSILATHYDLLNQDKRSILLQTVEDRLLDPHIGVRTVMPADFHELINVYKFQGMEAGKPYVYLNGGVWPHQNVWYALGLLHNSQVNDAKDVIKKYLTLEGIKNSPNGQPSFYEYRNTNVSSDKYGEIDKPTFLWAGGLYIHALYQLAGLRINTSNIYFSPELPDGFENVEYDLMLSGKLCRISWKGNGEYFKSIYCDGVKVHSAVSINAKKNILFERGKPASPYLAQCTCNVKRVDYNRTDGSLMIDLSGIPGIDISLQIISPDQIAKYYFKEKTVESRLHINQQNGIFIYTITGTMTTLSDELIVYFKSQSEH